VVSLMSQPLHRWGKDLRAGMDAMALPRIEFSSSSPSPSHYID